LEGLTAERVADELWEHLAAAGTGEAGEGSGAGFAALAPLQAHVRRLVEEQRRRQRAVGEEVVGEL